MLVSNIIHYPVQKYGIKIKMGHKGLKKNEE